MAHNRNRRKTSKAIVTATPVERLIYLVRGERVIVDADLAFLYGVTTKRLNEQVRRNRERFPADFMFQTTWDEAEALRSQIATLNVVDFSQPVVNKEVNDDSPRSQIATLNVSAGAQVQESQGVTSTNLRSQIATSKRGGNVKYRPFAFTEHGAIMAATVLNSSQAVKVSVFVVRAFVRLRGMLSAHRELAVRIDELERNVELRLQKHDGQIRTLFDLIRDLIEQKEEPAKPPIGFQTELGEGSMGRRRLRRAQVVKG